MAGAHSTKIRYNAYQTCRLFALGASGKNKTFACAICTRAVGKEEDIFVLVFGLVEAKHQNKRSSYTIPAAGVKQASNMRQRPPQA